MKTVKTSRVLALVIAIAMMIGLATTAFAAVSAELYVDDTEYTDSSYDLQIGDVIYVDALVYDGITDKTSSTSSTLVWEVLLQTTDVATSVTTPSTGAAYATLSYVAGTDYKQVKITAKAEIPADVLGTTTYALELVATPTYSGTAGAAASMALAITDGRTDLSTLLTGTGTATAFTTAPTTDITLTKSQITYSVLQAIYNLEDEVDFAYGDIIYTIDGLNMSSFTAAEISAISSIMDFAYSTAAPSRTVRAAIAEASVEYGQAFTTSLSSDVDDRDYFVLDLSDITIPEEVDGMTMTLDTVALYGTDVLGDAAYNEELYMYAYADGEFTLYETLTTTTRSSNDVAIDFEDGDQAYYILTTNKLVKAAATSSTATSSVAPVSSAVASSTAVVPIPDTSDANVIAIAAMMAVIAMAGAAVVAKKATK